MDLDQIQVLSLGEPIGGCGYVAMFMSNWLSATKYMFVNKEGHCFVKEDGTRYEMSMAKLQQTEGQMRLIVDSSEIARNGSRAEQITTLTSDGHIVVIDTLEELAEKHRSHCSEGYRGEVQCRHAHEPGRVGNYELQLLAHLMELRVNRSIDLLMHTDKMTTEIAYERGFESQSYFNQCFEKVKRIASGQFRKEALKNTLST